jgi:hypothetical protein
MNKETTAPTSTDVKSALNSLDTFLDLYLVKKAPSLPENVKELIVKFSPYLSIVALVFTVPALLALLGLYTFFSPAILLAGAQYSFGNIIGIVFLLATLALEAMAIPGLFARKASAWKLIFYVTLVSAVDSLIHFNLGGLIIGTAISLYFLYQVKSYYKN